MPNTVGTQIARTFDWVVCKTAGITFDTIQYFNKKNPNPSVTPKWSDKPLLKSWEKTKPTLGFPRQTDSLCPACVKEAREAIIAGKKDWRDLMHEKVGEIKAQIIERDGQVWMVKDCPLHGHYEDMMAVDAKFLEWIEKQFSGGEPTMSPYFFDAVSYARKIGYNSVQAATNGIEFAKSKEFCKKAFEAGMRYAYLQFDGIGNDANGHRQIGNLFDVKLRAIENMHEAGIEIVLVVTIVNNVNNDQVGAIVKFAMENPKKIAFVSFQPVSFTGRDEDITPERRLRQRYTLSHLAKDVSSQVGKVEPTRD